MRSSGGATASTELVIPPRSKLIGQRFYRGMMTESGELRVVAVMRNGQPLGDDGTDLAAGDALLVRGTWKALSAHIDDDPDVLAVDPPDVVRRQVVPLGRGRQGVDRRAGGDDRAARHQCRAAGGRQPARRRRTVLLGVLTIEQAYRAIAWTTVILVAGMIPLSTAMRTTGAAEQLAERLVDIVGDSGPYPLLIGLFILTAVLGQLISNMATALIVIPIALSAAAALDVGAAPVLMSLNVATSAALLTPVATPANLMVMEPGGYKFGDYWKIGLPLLVWFFVMSRLLRAADLAVLTIVVSVTP